MIKDLEGRIRYVADWDGRGEFFLFETKHKDGTEWSLESAFKLLDYDHDGIHRKAELISYQALSQIRQWHMNGIPYHFGE